MLNNQNFPMLFIIATICYVMGSIPTAFIIGKIVKHIDIRKFGSGNVGATNAIRVLGKKWGIITLLCDILKGFIPVFLIGFVYKENSYVLLIQAMSGLVLVFGHIFTIFLKFKGGKGVASAAGFLLALTPIEIGFTILIFIITLFSSKMVSLGSIISAVVYPLFLII